MVINISTTKYDCSYTCSKSSRKLLTQLNHIKFWSNHSFSVHFTVHWHEITFYSIPFNFFVSTKKHTPECLWNNWHQIVFSIFPIDSDYFNRKEIRTFRLFCTQITPECPWNNWHQIVFSIFRLIPVNSTEKKSELLDFSVFRLLPNVLETTGIKLCFPFSDWFRLMQRRKNPKFYTFSVAEFLMKQLASDCVFYIPIDTG